MQIIGGTHKGRKLTTPKGLTTRPTSGRLRETLFNICQGYIEGIRFLDLFAGSGAMGLEAISRGARQAIFVDNHKESLNAIRHNTQLLHAENQVQVVFGDVFQVLDRLAAKGESYDIIYADPPYDTYIAAGEERVSFGNLILKKIDESSLLVESGDLFIEDATEAKPPISGLTTLELISIRRNGKALLQQYRKKAAIK